VPADWALIWAATQGRVPEPFADNPVNVVLSAYLALERKRKIDVNALNYSAALCAKIQTHDPQNKYKLGDFLPYAELSKDPLPVEPTVQQAISSLLEQGKIPSKLYVELQKLCLIEDKEA